MILLNFDKRGAEWVIVAYLSQDANMLRVVKEGLDAHSETGHLMTGIPVPIIKAEHKIIGERTDPNEIAELRAKHFLTQLKGATFLPRSMSIRQAGKKSNHGLNYDEHPNTFSISNEMELGDAKRVWALYRQRAYPGVVETFHAGIQQELRDCGRTLTNLFGHKCYFMQAWGQEMFRAGYAYKPQSTVARMVLNGMALSLNDEAPFMEPLQALSQVHDSGVYQYGNRDEIGGVDWYQLAQCCIRVGLDHFSPELHYKDETFKLATDLKIGRNWGHMIELPLTEDVDALASKLEEAWDKANCL